MKTCLVTTAWLENPDYLKKTSKYINYYYQLMGLLNIDKIYIIDNASDSETIVKFQNELNNEPVFLVRFTEHMSRKSHLDYEYLWRAVFFYEHLFKQGFDKIIYTDNDFYMTSYKMIHWALTANSGWESPYCSKHGFPETGCQIITKDCDNYKKFIANSNTKTYNGKVMETTLPLSKVDKTLNGNRWSEFQDKTEIPLDSDFSAQTPLDWPVIFNKGSKC